MYDPHIKGERLTFGTSGKLYKSALVMYDRRTESLWSQIMQQAIAGPMTGTRLAMLPATHTNWADWVRQHPNTLVLSPDTGTGRDYGFDPYVAYVESGQPKFRRGTPPSRPDVKLGNMDRVVGIEVAGIHKAYPFRVLEKRKQPLRDTIGDQEVLVRFDAKSDSAFVTDAKDRIIPSITLFWFAWLDFYPATQVYQEVPRQR